MRLEKAISLLPLDKLTPLSSASTVPQTLFRHHNHWPLQTSFKFMVHLFHPLILQTLLQVQVGVDPIILPPTLLTTYLDAAVHPTLHGQGVPSQDVVATFSPDFFENDRVDRGGKLFCLSTMAPMDISEPSPVCNFFFTLLKSDSSPAS